MPKLSLTEFVDVIIRSGTQKVDKIRAIKAKPIEYSPKNDFYRALRNYIVEYHKNRLYTDPKKKAKDLTSDPKKFFHYTALLDGYWSFLGKRQPTWFDPPKKPIIFNNVELIINPELGLDFKGKKQIIKLYFKKDEITKKKIEIVLGLLEYAFKNDIDKSIALAVLDVRKGKLIQKSIEIPLLIEAIEAECAYISSIWDKL